MTTTFNNFTRHSFQALIWLAFVAVSVGWGVATVEAATLSPSLSPVASDGTKVSITYSSGTTAWSLIDDDPDSPTTGDYITNAGGTASAYLNFTDMPSDFESMDTLQIDLDLRPSGFSDDTSTVYAQIFATEGGTTLSNEMTLGTQANTGLRTATFTGLSASDKSTWNNALIRLRWTYSQTHGPDSGQLRVTAVELDGTYNVALPNATTTQRAFVFQNDDGSSVLNGSTTNLAATNTALTNVKLGERMVVKFNIDANADVPNTKATTTRAYTIQYENNTDSPGTWTTLSTTTPIALSRALGAGRNRLQGIPIPEASVLSTCNLSGDYIPGRMVVYDATTTPISIPPDGCTDFGFAIHTGGATAGKTYRLRLVDATTGDVLETYSQYPTLSIAASQTGVISKQYIGSQVTRKSDYGYNNGGNSYYGGHNSSLVGVDTLPWGAMQFFTSGNDLASYWCSDPFCTGTDSDVATVASTTAMIGDGSRVIIGNDGNPIIATRQDTNNYVYVFTCNDRYCQGGDETQAVVASGVPANTTGAAHAIDITLKPDGNPILAYFVLSSGQLRVVDCLNATCTSTSSSSLITTITPSNSCADCYVSIVIGSDGYPLIAFHDEGNGQDNLNVAKCNDATCSSAPTITTIDNGGAGDLRGAFASLLIGSDGLPIIGHVRVISSTYEFRVTKCNDIACSGGDETSTTIHNIGTIIPAMTEGVIGANGLPIFVHGYDNGTSDGRTYVIACNDHACTGSDEQKSFIDPFRFDALAPQISIGSDGNPIVTNVSIDDTKSPIEYTTIFTKCLNPYCSPAASTTANIRSDNSDLSFYLDDDGYDAASTSDNVYDTMSAASSSIVYNFRYPISGTLDSATIGWEGQVSESKAVTLQVYRFGSTNAWETITSNGSPSIDTDFVLTGSPGGTISEYSNSGELYARVVMATTSGYATLSTDQASSTLAATPVGLFQRDYIFYNDEGAVAIVGSSTALAATSTALTDVRVGQRLIAKFHVDYDESGASTTVPFKLQYENNTDAAGTWADVSSTTPIKPSLGQFGRNRVGSAILATTTGMQVLSSCTNGGIYQAGFASWGDFATLPSITLDDDDCADLAFSIHTASTTLGKTYRLRLINADDDSAIDNYEEYPTFSIQSSASSTISKQSFGPATTTVAQVVDDPVNTVGQYTSLAIGTNGNPIISYYDSAAFALKVAACNDRQCTTATATIVDDPANSVGLDSSLAIGLDGNPVISYYDGNAQALRVTKCNDPACTGSDETSTTVDDPANNVGQQTSLAIGTDGNPVISHYDATAQALRVTKCNDPACTGSDETSTTVDDPANNVGSRSSLAIGLDGNPVISYLDSDAFALKVAACNDPACAGGNETITTVDDPANNVGSFTSLAIGTNGNPVISYYDSTAQALKVAACNDPQCTGGDETTTIVDDPANNVGWYTSLTIGTDGNPVISYYDLDALALRVTKCNDPACTGSDETSTTVDDSTNNVGQQTSLAIGTDGNPVISYYDSTDSALKVMPCHNASCTATGTLVNLPTTTTDLSFYLDDTGYTAVASVDDTYDTLSAASSSIVYNLRLPKTDTDPFGVMWKGYLSEGVTTTLDVYRFGSTNAWEEQNSLSGGSGELRASITSSVSEYISNNTVYARVRTATTTNYSTLSTDYFGEYKLTQRAYQFRNDEGAISLVGSSTYMAATSTAITDVKIGQRLNVIFNVDAGITDPSPSFKLQFEDNTAAPGTWNDVASDAIIKPSLGQFGRNRVGSAVLATSTALRIYNSCNDGGEYQSGFAQWGDFVSLPPLQLASSSCADLAFSINTASTTLGRTYRLRLVEQDDTLLTNYNAYPTLTIQSSASSTISKQTFGGAGEDTSLSLDNLGTVADIEPSVAIGSDGYPILSYYDEDAANLNLKVVKCHDPTCLGPTTVTTVDSGGDVGGFTSISIGSDGYPIISYYDASNGALKVAKCHNHSCSSNTPDTVDDPTNTVGEYTAIAIGSDGLPVIAYRDTSNTSLWVAKCNDLACSGSDEMLTEVDNFSGSTGFHTDIAIGLDGNPIITYRDASAQTLKVIKCNDAACEGDNETVTTLDSTSNTGLYTEIFIRPNGNPLIAYYDQGNTALRIADCNDPACTGGDESLRTLVGTSTNVGEFPAIVLSPGGMPSIFYHDSDAAGLAVIHCNDMDCDGTSDELQEIWDHPFSTVADDLEAILSSTGEALIFSLNQRNDDLVVTVCHNTHCDPTASSTANVKSDYADLATYLDDTGYDAASTSDDVYDTMSAASSSIVYNFRYPYSGSLDTITLGFEGQVSESQNVALEIYRFGSTNAWEELDSDASPTADTDFVLTGSPAGSVSEYGSSGVVYGRVVYATTTNYATLSVDQASSSITTTPEGIFQREYIFYNDEGAVAISGSSTALAATSTALTDVRQGQRLIVKFHVDYDEDSASTTIPFKLQYENNTDSPGAWVDVSTTTPIRPSLGQFGRNRTGGTVIATTTALQVMNTCANGGTYREGYAQWGDFPSLPPLKFQDNECADFVFGIHTASTTLGKTYRLRLINAEDDSALENYSEYPTLTIQSSASSTISKQTFGPATTTVAQVVDDPANNVGWYSAIAIGLDGNPVISYVDTTDGALKVTKCNDPACTGGDETSTTVDDPANSVGLITSIAIGADGNPVISYRDNTAQRLRFTKCNDPACTGGDETSATIDDPGHNVGFYTSIAIGADGNPVISHADDGTANALRITKCNDPACTGADETSTTVDDVSDSVGDYTSIAIGLDGNPVISYRNTNAAALRVTKCNDPACTGGDETSTTVDDPADGVGWFTSIAIGLDGNPVIAHRNTTAQAPRVTKCNDPACTGADETSTTIDDTANDSGYNTSIGIGHDGNPVLSYYDNDALTIKVVKCNDPACTGGDETITTIDSSANDVNAAPSLAIRPDGNPIIAYRDAAASALEVMPCHNASCTATGTLANIKTDYNDLNTYLDDTGYDATFASDNVRDIYSAASSTIVYNARRTHANNTDQIVVDWEGQVSEQQPVTLELYRFGAVNAWEEQDIDASPTVDTDFTLATTVANNLSDYYAPDNTVYARVTYSTTTNYATFSVDEFSIAFNAVGAAGTLTLGDTGTQELNKIKSQTSVTQAELLNFTLTAADENIDITNLAVQLYNFRGFASGDFTNIELWRDNNQDQAIDGGDTQVGGVGSFTTYSGQSALQFSTTFTVSTGGAEYYIVRADLANINPGDEFVAMLRRQNISATGATSAQSIDADGSHQSANHSEDSGFRGGASIGGSGAASQGVVTGGGSGGGATPLLGNDPNYEAPTALGTVQAWTNSSNAFSSNNSYALASTDVDSEYANFNLNVPSGNTIEGIEVRLEASVSQAGGTIGVELSSNAGTAFTSSGNVTDALTTSDAVYTVGGPSDLWGRSWASTDFNNGNFEIRVNANESSNIISLDAIEVRVYHKASGGGVGGGGGIVYVPWHIMEQQRQTKEMLATYQAPNFSDWLRKHYVAPTLTRVGENLANVFKGWSTLRERVFSGL